MVNTGWWPTFVGANGTAAPGGTGVRRGVFGCAYANRPMYYGAQYLSLRKQEDAIIWGRVAPCRPAATLRQWSSGQAHYLERPRHKLANPRVVLDTRCQPKVFRGTRQTAELMADLIGDDLHAACQSVHSHLWGHLLPDNRSNTALQYFISRYSKPTMSTFLLAPNVINVWSTRRHLTDYSYHRTHVFGEKLSPPQEC